MAPAPNTPMSSKYVLQSQKLRCSFKKMIFVTKMVISLATLCAMCKNKVFVELHDRQKMATKLL